MSISTKETIFGTITCKNNQYDLLTQPLSEEQFKKIDTYKKANDCGISSAPWQTNKYHWNIEDNKLYLTEVYFDLCPDKSNLIQKIFKEEKVFAKWLNKSIKLLVSKKDIDENYREREVLILDFNNGMLVDTKKDNEKYKISRLSKYTEM